MKKLFLFLSLCLLLVACSPSTEIEVVSKPLTSPEAPYPIETPTQQAYIITMPTPLPPTDTPSVPPTIRPTPTNTPTSTATPIPTPVPLPDSGSAIWVETYRFELRTPPSGIARSTFYEADPRDMANRQQLLELPDAEVISTQLSPTGDKIAYTIIPAWRALEQELWVWTIGEPQPRLIASGVRQLLWKPDGSELVYTTIQDNIGKLYLLQTINFESTLLFEAPSVTGQLMPLTWGTDNQLHYFVGIADDELSLPTTLSFQSMNMAGSRSPMVEQSFTSTRIEHLLVSPNGSRVIFLFIDSPVQEIRILDYPSNQILAFPIDNVLINNLIWITDDQLIEAPGFSIKYFDTINFELQLEQRIEAQGAVTHAGSPSNDGKWIYALFSKAGSQFWHLESNTFVPVPQSNGVVIVAGWR